MTEELPNFGAFMATDKARSESATVAGDLGIGPDDDRESFFSSAPQPQAQPQPVQPPQQQPRASNPLAAVNEAEGPLDGFESEESGEFVPRDQYDMGSESDYESDGEESVFEVPKSKIRRPRFPNSFTGFQWCRRKQKIIEKLKGSPLSRQITHNDNPEEYAIYLITEEQDVYTESTCRWLTQFLTGTSGAMESGAGMLRKRFPKAPIPNLDGLTDNQLGVLEEYEVLFMEMDGTVGERFRQLDPMVRVAMLFTFQVITTAAINAKMGAAAGASSDRDAAGVANVMSMAQKMSGDILKTGGGAEGNVIKDIMSSMAPMIQSIMPQMGAALSDAQKPAPPPTAEEEEPESVADEPPQAAQVIDVMGDEDDEDDDVQVAPDPEPTPERFEEADSDSDASGDFEMSAGAAQHSRTINLDDYE